MKKKPTPKVTPEEALQQIIKKHMQVRSITQDILCCTDSIEKLNALNENGRCVLSQLRQSIEDLEGYARSLNHQRLIAEMTSQKIQLQTNLRDFRTANMESLQIIEKAQRDELLNPTGNKEENSLRNRKKIDHTELLKKSTDVTEQLLNISRQLADTNKRSQDTLDNLVSSSTAVHGTQSELQNTAGTISQSGKLLKKYGRREFTDKIIMLFAFLFFIAVCLYIVQKRIF